MVEPKGTTGARVILTGRATTVPLTPVMSGPRRTTADNTSVAVPAPLTPVPQLANPLDLALGAGGRFVQATIGTPPGRADRASLGEEPRPAMSNVIGRALANSACRSSGHNLGSQRAFLSRALLARRRHLMPDLVATQGERWPAKLDDAEVLAFSRP